MKLTAEQPQRRLLGGQGMRNHAAGATATGVSPPLVFGLACEWNGFVLFLFMAASGCTTGHIQPMPPMPNLWDLRAAVYDSARSADPALSERAACLGPRSDTVAAIGVSKPVLLRLGPLKYPTEAQREGLQGWVALSFLIQSDGFVASSSLLVLRASDRIFVEAAMQAAGEAVFKPALKGGEPVQVCGVQPVIFRLY